jgi:ketosteroid isomerase-like protein
MLSEVEMISTELVANLDRFYSALRGTSDNLFKAFDDARGYLFDDRIEWIEGFGTLTGIDAVIREIVQKHTTAMKELQFDAEALFPTRDNAICVFGRAGGTLLSGNAIDGRFVHIWEFAGERAVRMSAYGEDGVIQRGLGLAPDADLEQTMAAVVAMLAASQR